MSRLNEMIQELCPDGGSIALLKIVLKVLKKLNGRKLMRHIAI